MVKWHFVNEVPHDILVLALIATSYLIIIFIMMKFYVKEQSFFFF